MKIRQYTSSTAATESTPPGFYSPASTLQNYEVEELSPQDLLRIIRQSDMFKDSEAGRVGDREGEHLSSNVFGRISPKTFILRDEEVEELSECDLGEITQELSNAEVRGRGAAFLVRLGRERMAAAA